MDDKMTVTIKLEGVVHSIKPTGDGTGVEIEFTPRNVDLWQTRFYFWLENAVGKSLDYCKFSIDKNRFTGFRKK